MQTLVGAVVMATALLVVGSSAGAHVISSSLNYYWTGTDGNGTVWCAANQARIGDSAANRAQMNGTGENRNQVFCTDIVGAPAGYINADTRLRKNGAVCRDWNGYTQNLNGVGYATELRFEDTCGAGNYEVDTYTAVAVLFGWRYGTNTSPVHGFSA